MRQKSLPSPLLFPVVLNVPMSCRKCLQKQILGQRICGEGDVLALSYCGRRDCQQTSCRDIKNPGRRAPCAGLTTCGKAGPQGVGYCCGKSRAGGIGIVREPGCGVARTK